MMRRSEPLSRLQSDGPRRSEAQHSEQPRTEVRRTSPTRRAPRWSVALMTLCVAAAVSGCTNLAAPPITMSKPQFDQRMTTGLKGCGLSFGQPGVSEGSDGSLALRPESAGHPTSVTVVTAKCVLDDLGLPVGSEADFVHDSIYGGNDAANWNHMLASWYFHDTLDFKVDIVPA